ncbi:RNA ligase-domain-containing protein [Catenaria anguillulae PL171]|uniref:RNA ligase-domain-containing protein n=1 Tax=Catenaria anguillulae PL171 TaxID=765915 RepID=A0A1Y2HNZ4_9FUNG|nr:RNA ligase-domain-containing protein [Catenaria anguillulae PL171]
MNAAKVPTLPTPSPTLDWQAQSAAENQDSTPDVPRSISMRLAHFCHQAPIGLKPGTIRLTPFQPTKLNDTPGATIYPDLPCLRRLQAVPRNNEAAEYEVVIRGYDKFFNIGEVPATNLKHLQAKSTGPYFATVKENGCIIYISAADADRVYVASKHSLTSPHAVKGAEWLDTHLERVGKSAPSHGVFELADDQFEEHVLAYPPELSGLWLHGLNYNTIEFRPVEMKACEAVAKAFGFHMVGSIKFDSFDDMLNHARTHVRIPGHSPTDPPRDIEGWVLRYTKPDGHTGMTKYKYQQPYLLYREWRELTRTLLTKGDQMTLQPRHFLSHGYLAWVKQAVKQRPELFSEFKNQRGIIAGRTVIVPVACVGVGKTTVGATLHSMFPNHIAHVQNDNIANKRPTPDGRRPFDLQVVNALASRPVVYADRNNHMRELRDGLVDAVRETYPDATIVFAVWPLPEHGGVRDKVCEEVTRRIKARGENHQKLDKVIRMFVYKREEVSEAEVAHAKEDVEGQVLAEDGSEEGVVRAAYVALDVFASPAENVKRLVDGMAAAGVEEAKAWVEPVDAQLKSGALAKVAEEVSAQPVQVKVVRNGGKGAGGRKIKYYGLAIEDQLDALAQRAGVTIADMLIPKDELHVTIVHDADVKNAAAAVLPAQATEEGDAFAKVDKKGKHNKKGKGKKKAEQPQPPAPPATPAQLAWDSCEDALSRHDNNTVTVDLVLDQYRSSDRVSAFRVKEVKPVMGVEWDVPLLGVRTPHVTAGVAEGAKPVEANGLFADSAASEGVDVVDLSGREVVVRGVLKGFGY